MEKVHNVKATAWVTEEPLNLRQYFNEYHQLLDDNLGRPHESKINATEAMQHLIPTIVSEGEEVDLKATIFDDSKLHTLEERCKVELLDVEEELPVQNIPQGPIKFAGRLTNWYAGGFEDGVVPESAANKLHTLKAQSKDLHDRDTVRDYAKLINRRLKYFSTVRMPLNEDNNPEPTTYQKDAPTSCLRDIVLNVRIKRPYMRKTHMKKACNPFPSHSQELLVLGSQKLTELRDAILCINDLGVGQDLSSDPQFYHMSHLPNNGMMFPSGLFYINGVFYDDTRRPDAKVYSDKIIQWARKYEEIGELEAKPMQDTTILDLEVHLGYPYVFLHQGNCEHIIVFTDVRLHHRSDVQDPARYPVLRGQSNKLSVKCSICQVCLANWILKDDTRFPMPAPHVCDRCLKSFCYNANGEKLQNFRVYPFFDEFISQQKKIVGTPQQK